MIVVGKFGKVTTKTVQMIGLLGGILLLLLVAASCDYAGPPPSQRAKPSPSTGPVLVQVVEAAQGRVASTLAYTGDVQPKAQVMVSSKTMGRIQVLGVDVGSTVRAGDIIGRLEASSLEPQVKQAESALLIARAKLAQVEAGGRAEQVAQAQATFESARERLAAMQEDGREESVAQAAAALRAAEARLAQLKAGPTAQQVAEAEAAVRAAKNQLYSVQTQADAYLGSSAVTLGAMVFTREMKEAQSGAAYEQVKMAEARLAELKAPATPEQVAQADAAVDQARAALELARKPYTPHDLKQAENAVTAAEEQWKLAQSPYTREDLDVARALVAQAEANLDLAKSQLAETEIVAPIDGVVAERLLSVGGLAAPQVPILTIVSVDLEIMLSVEEARAREVSVGQPVSLTVAAYPDASFAGIVANVAPTIDTRSRAFAVKVSPDDPENKLRAGMLAKINLSLTDDRDAVLVPERAIVRRGTEKVVFAVVDGRAQLRRVESGASDGQNVEILSGLKAGDRIAVGSAALSDGDAVVAEGT